MSHCVYLQRLEKQHRRENVANTETYRVVSAYDGADCYHIHKKEIAIGSILKILPKSIFSRKEDTILAYLSGYNRVLSDSICWEMTDPDGEVYIYRVMDYVPLSLVDMNKYPTDVLKNIFQQIAFCILELNITYGVCHSRLHRGNIRVKPSLQKVTTYVIGGHQVTLPTLGYEPIFLDFQWAILYREISIDSCIRNASDSLARIFHTLSYIFVTYKDILCNISLEFCRCNSIEQFIDIAAIIA